MDNIKIATLSELDNEYKEKAVLLFVEGFYNVFTFTKDRNVLKQLFLYSLDFSLIYIAIYDNCVVGFMGIGNNKKRTMHFNKIKCMELFGKVRGSIAYRQLSALLGKPAVKGDKDLYIDYITTDKRCRGKGIATKLIEYACKELGYGECYIDVLSKNITAKRLYQHIGFAEYKKMITLIPKPGTISKMKKRAQ